MARYQREQFPGAFCHVMSRGNEKQNIFRDSGDKERFLGYLKSATLNYGAVIHCYCLMENHFHLLLETPDGNIGQIMHYIKNSYSKFFNKKWERTGHLFQGPYKSIVVDDNDYLIELSRYIHLNPVKSGYVESPERYLWSSYSSYLLSSAENPLWVRRDFLLSVISDSSVSAIDKYKEFVEDKIGKDYTIPLWD